MFFMSSEDQPSLEGDEDPYLVDFEFARPQTAETQYTFETSIERNLNRHPDRQGVPTVTFSKLHDVYALGVVLLEIGIWQTALTVYNDACAQLKKGTTISPRGTQKLFIEVAKRRLPHHMGEGYLQGVLACLTGDLAAASGDGDFSMMFYSKVLQAIDIKKLA
ncbi:hypothetical protein BDZ45DRAFT_777843 [Acephala macrosclerotiorum]|nr:hypothetical protein BDZ45DRAFT_777843 [Acephala macrosclerotiorum]